MNRNTWEVWIKRFVDARERQSVGRLLGAFGVLISALPIAQAPNSFSITVLGFPVEAKSFYSLIAILAALALLVTAAQFVLHWIQGLPFLRWRFIRDISPRPQDWVPTNLAAFVSHVQQDIEAKAIAMYPTPPLVTPPPPWTPIPVVPADSGVSSEPNTEAK